MVQQRPQTAAFWAESAPPGDFAEQVRKYQAIQALIALPEGEAQKKALRDAARRYPGSLREGQLLEPARIGVRASAARTGADRSAGPRSDWRDGGDREAVVLWPLAHRMLADQLRWRRTGERGDVGAFLKFVQGSPDWPDAVVSTFDFTSRLTSRLAYMCLAVRCGHTLSALHAILFGVPLAGDDGRLAWSKRWRS